MNQRQNEQSDCSHPILLVDSYAHGISIGRTDHYERLELGLTEGSRGESPRLRSRYVMRAGGDALTDLERHLQRLSARGELRATCVVFGVTNDPFHPFDEKFATSMKFLELFERYQPGRLVVQTRSPLIVIAMPVLKKVAKSISISIGVETPVEEVRLKYTPWLPAVDERWKTVRALKKFGLRVGVQVGPILPYGDWRSDASSFADQLAGVADFITVRSFAQLAGGKRPVCQTARELARDRLFFWLRHDADEPLRNALERLTPEKLVHPGRVPYANPQIPLFA